MRYRLLALLCLVVQLSFAQFKYDNVAFRTVYINDLCDSLGKYPDKLILDVRTQGEFYDTSSAYSLNLGHLKGAKNIDSRELKNRLNEIRSYRDKPVFVICSHSQRSRVCSKLLADSGFTHVINVNGAMTEFNMLKNTSVPCVKDLYETANRFEILPPREVGKVLAAGNVFILDVRSDSAFRGITTDASINAQGRFKGATNIPLTMLTSSLGKVPTNMPVLVVGEYGRETNSAARILADNSYSNVKAAFNGMGEWINTSLSEVPQRTVVWENPNKFDLMTAIEFDEMLSSHPDTYILDIRTADEFNNQVKDKTWLNRGHIQHAVNIPNAQLNSRLSELNAYKNKDIIVYGFSTTPEVFGAAKTLSDNGFTKVHALTGGLWSVRSKAANQKGLTRLMKWVVDVPEENL